MSHPFKGQARNGRQIARSRYADGGGVDGDDYAVNSFNDAIFKNRSGGENKYIERTRRYPFRLGLGPSASEDYLAKYRDRNMNESESISNAVPRRKN